MKFDKARRGELGGGVLRSSEDEWGGVRCGEVSYSKIPRPRQLRQVALQPVAVAVSLSQSASQSHQPGGLLARSKICFSRRGILALLKI